LIGWICVWGALALTVIRGLPVIFDASSLWSKPAQPNTEQHAP
jgi:hypothetical protein